MGTNFIRTKMNGRILVSLSATIMMLILVDYDDAGTSEPEITDSPFGINTYGTVDVVRVAPYYKDIGVKFVRYWFDWANIEPEQGEFTWQQHGNDIDEQMIALKDANISVLGLLGELKCSPELNPDPMVETGGTPVWARRPSCMSDIVGCPPSDFQWYADFAAEVVRRYKPDGTLAQQEGWGDDWGIRHWEILNEPMYKEEWSGSPEEYVELLKLAYQAIKREDPEAMVMNGGLDSTPKVVSGFYKLEAKDYFDIFSFHFYTNEGQTYRDVVKEIRTMRQIMTDYSDADKPIWDTEGAKFFWRAEEKHQSRFEIKFFVTQLAEGIPKIFWFSTKDWPNVESGLFNAKFWQRPKLGYYTYKLMTDKLEGSDWDNAKIVIEDEDEQVYAYKLTKNGKSIYVAWWDYWDMIDPSTMLNDPANPKQMILPVDFSDNALVTSTVPNEGKGADLDPNEYPTFFPTQIVPVINGKVALQLGGDPVFLEPTTIHIDTMAPAKITDLAASDPRADSITLIWTAPGDDGDVGTATSYDIRYFTSPITEGNWAEAIQCINEPIPRSAGSEEAFIVTGLQPGVIYYFAMKAQDEAGNTSEISNTVEIHLATPWDVNDDGVVNILDLIVVGKHFGQKPPKERKADVNEDGTVDILDLAVVAKHFGERRAMPAATMTSARIAWEEKKTIQLRQGRVAEMEFAAHRAEHSAGFP